MTGIVTEDSNPTVLTVNGDLDASGPITGEVEFVPATLQGSAGSLTITDTGAWTYTADNGQSIIQTLGVGESLTESFTVMTVSGETQTVIVTINGVNDAPIAENDSFSIQQDMTSGVIDLLVNDTDIEDDSLSITEIAGTPIVPGTMQTIDIPNASVNIAANGDITVTPDTGFSGTVSFDYTISDGNGGTSFATVTGSVSPVDVPVIEPVNNPPTAIDDTATTPEETPVRIEVLDNDSDIDADTLTVTQVGTPENGIATLNSDGSISYTPNPNFNGTDSFTYTITDGNGGTSTAEVIVTVTPVNDVPFINEAISDLEFTTNQDTIFTGQVTAIDIDGDELTYTLAPDGLPANGTVNLDPNTGLYNFEPALGFIGTDEFVVIVDDGNGGTETVTIFATVLPVSLPEPEPEPAPVPTPEPAPVPENAAPVAIDDMATTPQDVPVEINILSNDSDLDGDTLTVIDAQSENGTVTINPDGTVVFTPDNGFTGLGTITYTITDTNGNTATANVTIIVTAPADDPLPVPDLPAPEAPAPDVPENDPPVAVNDAITIDSGQSALITILANDSDPNNDPLTVTSAQPENGTATINPDGTISYTPNADFSGVDIITYTISDGQGGSATAIVEVTVRTPAPLPQPAEQPEPNLDLLFLIDEGGRETRENRNLESLPFNTIEGNGFVVDTVQNLNANNTQNGDGFVSNSVNNIQAVENDPLDTRQWQLAFEVEEASPDTIISRDGRPVGELSGSSLLWDALAKSDTSEATASLLKLDALMRDDQIYITIRNGHTLSDYLQTVEMRLADGGKLPEWISDAGEGLYIIDPPIDIETQTFKILATFTDDNVITQEITINLQNGAIEAGEKIESTQYALTLDEQIQKENTLKTKGIADALGGL